MVYSLVQPDNGRQVSAEEEEEEQEEEQEEDS